MDVVKTLHNIIAAASRGEKTIEDVVTALDGMRNSVLEVDSVARLDPGRPLRTGFPEVILAEGKIEADLLRILTVCHETDMSNILVSRLDSQRYSVCRELFPDVEYHERPRLAVFRPSLPESSTGRIAIVTGGTADLALADEIAVICRYAGSAVSIIADVGVAGLHRLFAVIDQLRDARVVVCIAGMEAALPSVIAGLVAAPIIGVPSSCGYGVNSGGWNALMSMLGSCAPGLLTVNIDNGIGAAAAAHRINTLPERIPETDD
jgi:pyridinium-3,5-biscarboxylic acid mononucleotide synthase